MNRYGEVGEERGTVAERGAADAQAAVQRVSRWRRKEEGEAEDVKRNSQDRMGIFLFIFKIGKWKVEEIRERA